MKGQFPPTKIRVSLSDPSIPWIHTEWPNRLGGWLSVGQPLASQGWKFHVSCRDGSLEQLFEAVGSDLLTQRIAFKIARDENSVASINFGKLGPTQVGKVLTAYPDQGCVAELGALLIERCSQINGPLIDNELQIQPPLPIFLRYGGFTAETTTSELGARVPILTTPDGSIITDDRRRAMHIVVGLQPPLEGKLCSPAIVLAGRYAITGTLADKGYQRTCVAMDTYELTLCVIREAKRHCAVDRLNRDAAARLAHEAEMMKVVAGTPLVSELLDFRDSTESSILVRTHSVAETLLEYVARAWVHDQRFIDFVLQTAELVQAVHSRGLLILDLTPANLLLEPDFSIRLIDFEASQLETAGPSSGLGTHGYSSPRTMAGGNVTKDDDLYSLAAIATFLMFGVELSRVPDPQMEMLRTLQSTKLGRDLGRLLLTDDATTSDSRLRDAIALLDRARDWKPDSPWLTKRGPRRFRSAGKLAQAAAASAQAVASAASLDAREPGIWQSRGTGVLEGEAPWINSGDAGVGLGLLRIAHALSLPSVMETVSATAESMMRMGIPVGDSSLPGLFVGQAGVEWFYLAFSCVTSNPTWETHALDRAMRLDGVGCDNPYLFHGAAGIGLLDLWLFEQTCDVTFSRRAKGVARRFSSCASVEDIALRAYRASAQYEPAERYLGLAHGIAGIGFFLAECARILSDGESRDTAVRIAEFLSGQRIASPEAESVQWPVAVGADAAGGTWCHGSTGTALFLQACWQVTQDRRWLEMAIAACRTAVALTPFLGPTQCHGIAGVLEGVMSVSEAANVASLRTVANGLASTLLDRYFVDDERGTLFCGDRPNVLTPDFMIGSTGAASSIARYLRPKKLGHFLDSPLHAFRDIRIQ